MSEENEKVKKSVAKEILDWIGCIVGAFALAIFIKFFIFTPTLVQMSSMYPTIFSGERVFCNRLVRTFKIALERGDIITFEQPSLTEVDLDGDKTTANYYEREGFEWFTYNVLEIGKTSYIKRVIGLAGDHIKIEDGHVYLNDILLDETNYLPDETITYIRTEGRPTDFVVPEGYIFCMGDNRTNSMDCRDFGCIPVSKVEGKVLFRMWPLNRFGSINKSEITKEEVDAYNSGKRGSN